MLFNSLTYLYAFLPIAVVIFRLCGRCNNKNMLHLWLIACSFFFYAWWNPAYVWVLFASVAWNYVASKTIRDKTTLTVAIIGNLALLGYVKYANFFVDSMNAAFDLGWSLETVILPLAVSFFTFQQIAYLVDLHKKKAKSMTLIEYALFVSFFPQLIAGPIVHERDVMPQFRAKTFGKVSGNMLVAGLTVLSIGLFKKAVLGDSIGGIVDPIYTDLAAGSAVGIKGSVAATLGYGLQLYFDFSGYTDMALGSAMLFGIRLPENFLSPYKATNVREFWRRWHITLSEFLRDYLYIPLGGSRGTPLRTMTSLMITMLLGGLWHGAGWGFVLWGGVHGAYLCIAHIWKTECKPMHPLAAWGVTFCAVQSAWILFRAQSLTAVPLLWQSVRGGGINVITDGQLTLLFLSTLFVLTLPNTAEFMGNSQKKEQETESISVPLHWHNSSAWGFAIGCIALAGIVFVSTAKEFIYFQF